MSLEQDYYNLSCWLSKKIQNHRIAHTAQHKQIDSGEIWKCDLGYNIGTEKNKCRPVLVVSNNNINRSEKVIILCITKAQGKINIQNGLPFHNSWYLLFSNTVDPIMMYIPNRRIPRRAFVYNFLDKDSVVQCEEIKAVSKIRFINKLGDIDPIDYNNIKSKIKGTFDIP